MTDLNDPTNASVTSELASGVATITLDAPERKNALSPGLVTALANALDDAMTNTDVRVIVLTNTGTTFCAGADLKAPAPGQVTSPEGQQNRSFVDVFTVIQRGAKPVIGRINGHATGGGVGLVAVCDISVMRDDAKIGFTEVRIGVAPAIISVVCLPKMTAADAAELFLTGERIAPQRAVDVGLINRAVPEDELDQAVDGFIDQILKGGPNALGVAKELLRRVPPMDTDDAFAWAAKRSAELFTQDEAAAGIAAFRERRPAPWTITRS